MRITTRRFVGRLTSVSPAAANMLGVPTLSSPQVIVPVGEHRVALEGAGAALAGEVDRGSRERMADAAACGSRRG